MAKLGKKPSISFSPIKDVATRNAMQAIVEYLQIYEGSRGHYGDKSVTFKDLTDLGIVKMLGARTAASNVPTDDELGGVEEAIEEGPLEVTLEARGTVGGIVIFVSPVPSARSDVAYYELHRSADDIFGNAIQIATIQSGFVDLHDSPEGFYYWVRDVDDEGNPGQLWPGTNGVYAESQPDPAYILELLHQQITETQLYANLNTRINLIDSPVDGLVDRLQRYKLDMLNKLDEQAELDLEAILADDGYANSAQASLASVTNDLTIVHDDVQAMVLETETLLAKFNDNRAMIVTERQVRAASDGAFAQTFALLGATNGTNDAFILDQDTVEVTAGESLGTRLSQISADIGQNAADIITEQTARADGDGALAQTISLIGAENVGGDAFILDVDTVEVSAGLSIGTRFSTIDSNVDGNAAAITTEQNTRAANDTAIADELHLLGAQNGAQDAFILDTNTTKVDPTTSLAQKFTALETADGDNLAAIYDNNVARVGYCLIGGSPDGSLDYDACIAGGGTWQHGTSLAEAVKQVSITTGSGTATIEQKMTTVETTAEDAETTATNAQGTADGAQTTATNAYNRTTDLRAEYSVKLNANDHIAGFGLSIGGPTNNIASAFIVEADVFAVVKPDGTGSTIPFAVDGTGVGIKGALIIDGTVSASAMNIGGLDAFGVGTGNLTVNGQLDVNGGNLLLSHATANITLTGSTSYIAINGERSYLGIGKTTYGLGTGVWLGRADVGFGTPKFDIGTTTKYMRWDGNNLMVEGGTITGGVVQTHSGASTGVKINGSTADIELFSASVRTVHISGTATAQGYGTYAAFGTSAHDRTAGVFESSKSTGPTLFAFNSYNQIGTTAPAIWGRASGPSSLAAGVRGENSNGVGGRFDGLIPVVMAGPSSGANDTGHFQVVGFPTGGPAPSHTAEAGVVCATLNGAGNTVNLYLQQAYPTGSNWRQL